MCFAATEGLENMSFVANAISLVTYFYGYMNFSLTKSATTLTNFMGTAFILTLLGGFISDTYLSRFKTCVLFACIELVVCALLHLLLLHNHLSFRFSMPKHCNNWNNDDTSSFVLWSLE